MSVNEVYKLLKKFRRNECSPEETQQLNDWYQQFNEKSENIPGIPSDTLDNLWTDIESRVKSAPARHTGKKLINRSWLSIAALFVLVLGSSIYFLKQKQTPRQEHLVVQDVIQPGKKTAVLKLSDGREVTLTDVTSVKEKDGLLIKNEQSKQLDYSLVAESGNRTLINTIEIPVGGEYQLILADGTRVWLNSGTELTYPVVFSGDKREVELSGEAYFEVTKTGKPFIVKTKDVNIRVLGTEFNISAYAEDAQTISTLVAGSIAMQDNRSSREYMLKPGNSVFYNASNAEVEIKNVDTGLYTSWMKGEFRFINMRLEEIFAKLGRWYNCSVIYDDATIKNLRCSGAAEKDKAIDYVLKMIEKVTNVKFKINGTTITAYK